MRQRTPHRATQRRSTECKRQIPSRERDRRPIYEHERRAAEQPVAKQAWNDAEEQNTLSLVLQFSFSFFFFFHELFSHQKSFCSGLFHVEPV